MPRVYHLWLHKTHSTNVSNTSSYLADGATKNYFLKVIWVSLTKMVSLIFLSLKSQNWYVDSTFEGSIYIWNKTVIFYLSFTISHTYESCSMSYSMGFFYSIYGKDFHARTFQG